MSDSSDSSTSTSTSYFYSFPSDDHPSAKVQLNLEWKGQLILAHDVQDRYHELKNAQNYETKWKKKYGNPHILYQRDYFLMSVGTRRKKIRYEIENADETYSLIQYDRDNHPGSRHSAFTIESLTADQVKTILLHETKTPTIVCKQRYVWLLKEQIFHTTTRLHLDTVEGIPHHFVELELVNAGTVMNGDIGKRILDNWRMELELFDWTCKPVDTSYCDLLQKQKRDKYCRVACLLGWVVFFLVLLLSILLFTRQAEEMENEL